MDWIDYREKLGIGFNDNGKIKIFYTRISNVLNSLIQSGDVSITVDEYFSFCDETASRLEIPLMDYHRGSDRFRDCVHIIRDHESLFTDYLSYFVWFINCVNTEDGRHWNKNNYRNLLTKCLAEAHIPFDILEENGKLFIFPKGAAELDKALVSEPLEWLKDYPVAHKTYCIALRQYAEGIYIRDVADNLRKALEAFLQEFLGNEKNLETNKVEICRYLGQQGVDSGISGLFQPLINAYKNINDRIAKHHDSVDEKLLEFLLYQTGILIRMVLSVHKADTV